MVDPITVRRIVMFPRADRSLEHDVRHGDTASVTTIRMTSSAVPDCPVRCGLINTYVGKWYR